MLRSRLFPILIFLSGLCITILISYSSLQDMKKLKEKEMETIFREFENKIQIQLNANAQILYNSSAFISSSDTITREEWNEFQTLNKSLTELSGMKGIGYLILINPENLNRFEKQIQNEGFSDFQIHPTGKRDLYSSILFLEPLTGNNIKALGYDGYSESIRRKAFDLSRDSDKVMLSDKIYLIQETDNRTAVGTIMVAPVFRSEAPKSTIDERRKAVKGWVFSAFRMDNLISGVLGSWDFQRIRLKIFDSNKIIPEKLLFDSDSVYQINRTEEFEQTEFNLPMSFNDKVWALQFTNYFSRQNLLTYQTFGVLFSGTLISIMLFILALNLMNARSKTIKIQHLNEQLKKVNLSKDRFISVLAHDLKSPFNSLLGFSEVLNENINELSKEQIEEFARNINSSAQVTYLLLEELLLWARIQTDHFPFTPKVINLFDTCKQIIDDHHLIAAQKKITIQNELEVNLNVKADELMLKTILRNLISNAIKFTNEGGLIQIKAESKQEKVAVSISDNGIGMTSIELADLFDLSHVHSKLGTANEKGTGLGLLLCKDLVEKHSGEIWVESSPGKGSHFSFTLPEA